MLKRSPIPYTAATLATWLLSVPAQAGPAVEASGTAEASPDTGADAGGDTEVAEGRRYSERGRGRDQDKWIYRWAPVRNMWEFGVYGGVWFPSRHLELFEPTAGQPDNGHQLLRKVTPDVGLRAAYFPLRFLGIEVEGGVMPTKTEGTGANALPWHLRGHVIGQLGLWSITPFLLAGTGLIGVNSDAAPNGIGSEQDVAIHFGGGAKFYINRWIMLRLDVRDVVSNRLGVGEGLTSSPEILLGLSLTLRPKDKPRPTNNDRDGDRVRDEDDFCPDVYGEAPRGCPTVCVDDNDADGLANPEDKCPDDPETRNGFEDADGCPDEVPPELSDLAGIMEGIQFDTDKDTIKSSSRPPLDNAVNVLNKFPDLRVRIVGHTDSQGGYRHNIDLSQRRAKSVKKYLIDKGIDDSRIETDGVGPDQPIDTNDTSEGRQKNRRIEFLILDETNTPVTATPAKGAEEP